MKKENICNLEINIWDQIDSQLFVNYFNLNQMQVLEARNSNVILKNIAYQCTSHDGEKTPRKIFGLKNCMFKCNYWGKIKFFGLS